MKRKLIFVTLIVILAALAVLRYTLVEVSAPLPDEVRLGSALTPKPHDEAARPTEAPAPSALPTPEPTPVPVMQNGSRGDDVKTLQTQLREWGFMTGKADGIYGAQTVSAVQRLQSYLDALPQSAPNSSPAAAPLPGDTGGYAPADTPETAPENTEAPLEDAAPAYSGSVDQSLWDYLCGGGFSIYRENVSNGSSGAETERVQTRLITLGYLGGTADGQAGTQTASAIRSFQSSNGLSADGIAGKGTQKLLFSGSAKRYVKPAAPSNRYMLKIDTSKQRVYAYAWNKQTASYSDLARTMVCSTGKDVTPTPKGTFTSTSPVARWGYFPKYDVWAQYLYRINGSILFHSVLYTDSNESSLIAGSLYKLGTKASHGCVRLSVEDAKWIYTNCAAGTTIKVV